MIVVIKHIEIEGPGILGEWFSQQPWETKIVESSKGEALPAVDNCEAIISLGGPMSVYDTGKYPFLKHEEEFLKKALKMEKPILGICLGAQILAKISGAVVKKAPVKEIGWYDVELTGEGKTDSLFEGLGKRLSVFQWHEDTFEVSKEAELLATGNICKNQAFRLGNNAWGLQFHPEMTKDMLIQWLEYYDDDLDKDEIMNGYSGIETIYKRQAEMICDNFCKAVTASQNA